VTKGGPALPRSTPAGASPPTAISQLRLQPADEIGKPRLPFALETLGRQDRVHFSKSAIDVRIDHDVVVLRPVTHLVGRRGHAGADPLLRILRSAPQPPL